MIYLIKLIFFLRFTEILLQVQERIVRAKNELSMHFHVHVLIVTANQNVKNS